MPAAVFGAVWTAEAQTAFFRANPPRLWDIVLGRYLPVSVERAVAEVTPAGCYGIVRDGDRPYPCAGAPVAGRLFCSAHADLGWCERACAWAPPARQLPAGRHPAWSPPPRPAPARSGRTSARPWSRPELVALLAARAMGAERRALAEHHRVSTARVDQLLDRARRTATAARVHAERAERAAAAAAAEQAARREAARQAFWAELGRALGRLHRGGVGPRALDRAHALLVAAERRLARPA